MERTKLKQKLEALCQERSFSGIEELVIRFSRESNSNISLPTLYKWIRGDEKDLSRVIDFMKYCNLTCQDFEKNKKK